MRLKGTITFEYDADPEQYRGCDGHEVTGEVMATIDRQDLENCILVHYDLTDDFKVTVEPVSE